MPASIIPLFKLDPTVWKVEGDVLVGKLGDISNEIYTPVTVNPKAFRFGYKVKSRWYQMIHVRAGTNVFIYSRGHWENTGGMFVDTRATLRERGQELVEQPDEWHSLEVRLQNGALIFFYDGVPVRQTLLRPSSPNAGIEVGFGSWKAAVEIRDMFFSYD